MYKYMNIKTDEEVFEDDAEDYALDQLGIEITAKGKNGELTQEQAEFISTFTDWYFSDNWIRERVEDEDIPDLEYELEMADRTYQDNLDKKWGIA